MFFIKKICYNLTVYVTLYYTLANIDPYLLVATTKICKQGQFREIALHKGRHRYFIIFISWIFYFLISSMGEKTLFFKTALK